LTREKLVYSLLVWLWSNCAPHYTAFLVFVADAPFMNLAYGFLFLQAYSHCHNFLLLNLCILA